MRTNDYIEEVIEESYLIGLSETEIRANLDQFVDTCGQVIRDHVFDKKQMQTLAEKLARARALSLIEDRQESEWGEIPSIQAQHSLAERVARNKCLILRAIHTCDPHLVELIDQARFPETGKTSTKGTTSVSLPVSNSTRRLLIKIGSLTFILLALLLIYLALLQHV